MLTVSGCLPTTRTPERLYSLPVEIASIRLTDSDLVRDYYASKPFDARLIRNEIVAQRMYAIDLYYTEYEAALTRESQEVGFAALTTAGGLTTASTLIGATATKTILSAAATAVLGTKSHYESEILLAQTIRTIQKQMRSSRNRIAANIAARVNQSTAEYPLPAALSDVEDYYNAGTITTGVIDTSTTVGLDEEETKTVKQIVTQAPASERAVVLAEATGAPKSAVLVGSRVALRETGQRVARPTGPQVLDPFEASLPPATISEVQIAICTAPTGSLGPRDSDTRRAIADYLAARGAKATQAIDQRIYSFLDEAVEKVGVRSGGNCRKSKFANARAVGASFR